jgi:hypothetical protein
MFAELFVLLYVAHLVADYPLQTDHQAAHKAERSLTGWIANVSHAAVHFILCGVALVVVAVVLGEPIAFWPAVCALVWIGASHAVIDRRWLVRWWMTRTGQSEFMAHGGAPHIDQTAHILALTVAALALAAI